MTTNTLENKLKEIENIMQKYVATGELKIYEKNGEILSYAFIAKKDGKWLVVKDGKESQSYDVVKNLTYSPDGKHFAYIARTNTIRLVINDEEEKKVYKYAHLLSYSVDGSLTYVLSGYRERFIVKDGKTILESDYAIDELAYSPDGKSFAYVTEENGKYFVIKDGKKSEEYDDVYKITYSSDGKKFAYIAKKNGEYFIVENGERIIKDGYSFINEIIYSLDGKELAFSGRKDKKWYLVRNGKIVKQNDNLIYNLVYSSDGSLAYSFKGKLQPAEDKIAFKPTDFVVKNDKIVSEPYRFIEGIYSVGKNFFYIINIKGKAFIKIIK